MGQKQYRPKFKLISSCIVYLLITIIWSLVTIKTNSYESQNGYFEINALLKFKILLPAVVYGGRFLLFAKYRLGRNNLWFFPLSLFLVGWSVFHKLTSTVDVGYSLLIITDSIIWAFIIKEIAETVRTIIIFWKDIPRINYAVFIEIWARIENDLIRLGIWLTILIGLCFYYLVSFFIVDALFYSYLLLTPLFGCGFLLYGLLFTKIKIWIGSDLAVIDGELVVQLDWRSVKDDPELPQRTAWFQYLTLIRNYLKELQRPVFLLKPLLFYIVFSVLILSLPYFLGRVIEV